MVTSTGPLAYTVEEAARELGVSVSTVYHYTRDGRLPRVKVGRSVRVPREGIEAWLREHTEATAR